MFGLREGLERAVGEGLGKGWVGARVVERVGEGIWGRVGEGLGKGSSNPACKKPITFPRSNRYWKRASSRTACIY